MSSKVAVKEKYKNTALIDCFLFPQTSGTYLLTLLISGFTTFTSYLGYEKFWNYVLLHYFIVELFMGKSKLVRSRLIERKILIVKNYQRFNRYLIIGRRHGVQIGLYNL